MCNIYVLEGTKTAYKKKTVKMKEFYTKNMEPSKKEQVTLNMKEAFLSQAIVWLRVQASFQ